MILQSVANIRDGCVSAASLAGPDHAACFKHAERFAQHRPAHMEHIHHLFFSRQLFFRSHSLNDHLFLLFKKIHFVICCFS